MYTAVIGVSELIIWVSKLILLECKLYMHQMSEERSTGGDSPPVNIENVNSSHDLNVLCKNWTKPE